MTAYRSDMKMSMPGDDGSAVDGNTIMCGDFDRCAGSTGIVTSKPGSIRCLTAIQPQSIMICILASILNDGGHVARTCTHFHSYIPCVNSYKALTA